MSTALYRRYRPETFADVIGQEHVTEPLMAAIDKDRINHAYLFSGPRGCGKTTSARILARCLNCAQGPTSTPCGVCDSCVELARNGSGSLDVIEIDAASHGGVDDARDLRERATFAPVRDRFKIFIIDEAHMVTSAGFNALLKIVEEPPEHILFIFATTEPDKVIGTIRSRTHHYPFRLVPPEPLLAYLELLCHQENVPVAPGVLSLVIRAGGGSVRDSLSVLDQLMAGAGENGLDYELAVSLLGYTHATLLDDVVDSVAAGDAATVFNAVDRVIQTGHDPRRFVEDLLERFRDLIVINAVPEGAASILRGVPDDQLNRMRIQANQLGAGELSRAADVTNTALTEMTGATSPRLHLELLCARLLLPAADATERGTLARVDRIERRLEYAGGTPVETAPADTAEAPQAPARARLDVPRNAEEAAARWSLPAADSAAPAVPAAVPGAHAPAVPAAVRTGRPAAPKADGDSSPDWGGSWGVSTDSAFGDPEPAERPAAGPAGAPEPTRADAAPGRQAAETHADPRRRSDSPNPAQDEQQVPPSGRSEAGPAARPTPPPGQQTDVAQQGRPAGTDGQQPGVQQAPGDPGQQQDAPRQGQPQGTQGQPQGAQGQPQGAQGQPQQGSRRPEPGPGQPAASGGNVEMVRRAWPEILDEVAHIKRATWLIVNVAAKPRSFEGNQLVLAFANQGNAIGFQRGPHMDNLKQAIHKVLGLTCSIEAVHDSDGSGESGPKVPAGQADPGSNPGPGSTAPSSDRGAPRPQRDRDQPAPGAGGISPVRAATPDVPGGPAAPGVLNAGATGPGAVSAGPSPVGPSSDSPSSDSKQRRDVPATDHGTDRRDGVAPGSATAHRTGSHTAARPDRPARGTVPPAQPARPTAQPAQPATPGQAPQPAQPAQPAQSAQPAQPAQPARNTVQAHARPDGPGDRRERTPGDAGPARAAGPAAPRDAATARGAATGRRTSAPTTSEAPGLEAVSAWDPSMSDDSWAFVEPPEEAFDPGPGWDSVPEDPYGTRPPGSRGGVEAPHRNVPARADGAHRPGPAASVPSAPRAAPGAPAQQPSRGTAGPAGAPEPRPSRSVVWSPPPVQAPPLEAAPVEGASVDGAPGPRGRSEAVSAPTVDPGTGGTTPGTGRADPVPSAAGRPAGPVVPSFVGMAGAAALTPAPSTPSAAPASTRDAAGAAARGPAGVGPTAPAPHGSTAAPERPTSADNVRQKPVSRYQQLLDEAERKRSEEDAAARGSVGLGFVEDEPSADDETFEESGLVGRTAIERILNGRLVEERSVDGQ